MFSVSSHGNIHKKIFNKIFNLFTTAVVVPIVESNGGEFRNVFWFDHKLRMFIELLEDFFTNY